MNSRAWIEGPCGGCRTLWRARAEDAELPACTGCDRGASPLHHERVLADGSLSGCLACDHDELYWARDFPKALGIAVVVLAAGLAPFTMYISLAVGAALDAVLVLVVPKRLHCYRCEAMHHRFPAAEAFEAFQLEVSDIHQFGDKASVIKTLGAGHEPPHGRRQR